MSRQNPTGDDRSQLYKLSSRQHRAVDLVTEGLSDSDVAEEVGVTRQTVNSWRNRHPAFIAELNERRRSLVAQRQIQLDALTTEVLEAIRARVKEGDKTFILGLGKLLLPQLVQSQQHVGPVDPHEIVRRAAGDPLTKMLAKAEAPSGLDILQTETDLIEALRKAEEGEPRPALGGSRSQLKALGPETPRCDQHDEPDRP